MRFGTLFIATALAVVVIPRGKAGTLAEFRTPLGTLEVELFDLDKPLTTQNFIRYVADGLYRDMFIHRWEPGFVIQGGGFFTANRFTTNAVIRPIPPFDDIPNEYNVGRTFSSAYGTIAMARVSGLTNSANSQWFFNLTNNSALDSKEGGFTVFGRVLRGTNILNRFNNLSKTNGIFRIDIGEPLNHLPILSTNATYEDLVYVNVNLLSVQIQRLEDGSEQISWQSVSNLMNHVEFSTNIPSVWKLLATTNGTGAELKVSDSAAAAGQRFYRVRVDF